jgi:neuroligin
VRGEDVPYVLGLPLVGGQPFFPHNYTHQDGSVSHLFIHYLANFARKGFVYFVYLYRLLTIFYKEM